MFNFDFIEFSMTNLFNISTNWTNVGVVMVTRTTISVTNTWCSMLLKCNLISCWNYFLYNNTQNISWELLNRFEINQMNKKYEKTLIKHYIINVFQ
jgi:hypothetical protein